jgi:SAM-dependent methyltransferase
MMNTLPTAANEPSRDSSYLLDNAASETDSRFAALSAMFDPGTIRHLENRGVGPGWHCLEVGGGGGSIAKWLSDRVGSTGRVVVTDIDTRFLESLKLPNLEVWRHNIVSDPLPEASFDLVHARQVLIHVLDKENVLMKLIAALKPGGWLVDEDFDAISILPDPGVSPGEVLLKTHVAMGRLFADRGFDRRYGRLLFAQLRKQGLAHVDAEARMFICQRGSSGTSILQANYKQLRETLISAGYVTPQEFDEDLARLESEDFMMPSSILWAAWGRRL